jgi:CheY-like chemotaxis protein
MLRLEAAPPAPAPAAADLAAPTPVARPAPQPGRVVLIVDDNRDAADGLATLLTLRGHDVRVAYDGQAALERLAEFTPQVVMLDIGLPGMNGYDVAGAIRGRLGHTPVLVAMTGYGQDEDKARAKAAGFDHHLTKPFDSAALEAILQASATAPRTNGPAPA